MKTTHLDENGRPTFFNHSVKVPIQYKTGAKFLKINFEKGVSIKDLIFREKHAVSMPGSGGGRNLQKPANK